MCYLRHQELNLSYLFHWTLGLCSISSSFWRKNKYRSNLSKLRYKFFAQCIPKLLPQTCQALVFVYFSAVSSRQIEQIVPAPLFYPLSDTFHCGNSEKLNRIAKEVDIIKDSNRHGEDPNRITVTVNNLFSDV